VPVQIKNYRINVDNAIVSELNRHSESLFFTSFKNALKNGKRLRPIILLLAFESAGGEKGDPLPAAVAVELTHMQSLIHDDIIDRDLLRRGETAFHALYDHEVALLSADFVYSIILDIVARYEDHQVARILAHAASRMCEGELEEFIAFKHGKTISAEEYINISSKKTASLFEASATIGAVLAEGQSDEVSALSDYARLLGIAYQIQDDIADREQDAANSILNLLDSNAARGAFLQGASRSYTLEAKRRLNILKTSRAKDLLIELATFVEMGSSRSKLII
jgi:octaprenyl-diphosphate synthase